MKKIGFIGVSIPLLFVISFSVLFLIINPEMYEYTKDISLMALNIKGAVGQNWVAYLNYFSLGLLICVFCLLLLLKTVNSSITLAGKILLLISGLAWMALGLFSLDMSAPSTTTTIILVCCLLLNLGLGSIGFIFISANGQQFEKILKSNLIRWAVFSCGIAILIFWFMGIPGSDYQSVFQLMCSIFYFLGFGILGLGLIIEQKQQE